MADNQNLQSMAENLFEAMDIITSKRLSALEYDKTLVCTIESVEDAKNGIYKVTDGVSHFTAYSENTEYKEKTKVYVKVPNGDMDNQKIITGKYISKEVEYISYVSPLNNFIDVTGNLIETNPSLSLQANNENKKTITIWEIPERDSEGNIITPCSFKGYDRIGIGGDFKTYLDSYTRSGSYGLRLDIGERTEAGITKNHCFYLDSNDMYGNPYKYSTFFSQEQMYNISHIFEIISMRLVFYQKCDFFLENGTLHSVVEDKDNIFVENLYISFGFDVSNFTEDTVIIGTNYSLTYSTEMRPSERKAYMRWVHLKEDKFYPIDESSEIPEGAIIHWYRYKIEQDRSDEIAGYFWKEFNPGEDKFNYVFTPDDTVADDMLKVIIEYPSREYITDSIYNSDTIKSLIKEIKRINTQFNENVLDGLFEYIDVDKINEEYFKAKTAAIDGISEENISKVENALDEIYNTVLELRSSTKYYSSENLHFRNEIMMSDEAIDLVQSLSIQVDPDNQEGVYRLYDETNNIINSSEANKLRTLKAQYNSVVIDKKELDSAEEITWFIPINNTMIHEPIDGKEYNTEDGDIFIRKEECEKAGYVAIKRLGEDTTDELIEGVHLIEIEQKFRIKDYYTQTASNNIIYCQVKKRGRIYEASASLLFGTSGSNGTEATFLLKMYDAKGEDEVNALTISDTVMIKPELYDFNNKRLPIDRIEYSWKEENNSNVINISKSGITCSLYFNTDTNIDKCQFYVLQAFVEYSAITDIDKNGNESNRKIKLSAFLPIPVRTSNDYTEIEGATKIVYDSNGCNPRYYKNPYKLYGKSLEGKNIEWYINFNEKEKDYKAAKRYYPVIQTDGKFMPTKMYYTGLKSVCVNAYVNNDMVWTQPLLIIQNRYASAMLNDWDGNLTINEKNDTILSAMIGAGVKNDDNTFSGIVMGDMGKVSDNFDPNNKTGVGLYGLDHGAQSYGFKIDGTAFIGKSGSGRINFDGNKGTITSGNYEENKAGMQIDLDYPFLKAYGDAGSFEMDLKSKENKPLLLIKDTEGHKLMYISGTQDKDKENESTKYYLQSSNYNASNKTGLRLDLENSKFSAYGNGGSVLIDAGNKNALFKVVSSTIKKDGSEGNILINIAGEEGNYYIQSDNFSSNDKGISSGMKININKGIIDAIGLDKDDNYIGDIHISAGGDPYFRIRTFYDNDNDNEKKKNLIYISKDNLYLQSADFNYKTMNESGKGTKINLSNGSITSYNFTINAYGEYQSTDETETEKEGYINIDSNDKNYPLDINGRFKVDWGGNIKATGGTIGGWKISEDKIYSNNIILYSSSEKSGIYAGKNAENFESFKMKKIKVNTSTAEVSDIDTFNAIEWEDLDISDDNNKYFYVNDDGVLEAYVAQIQYLKAKTLYVENMYLGKRKVEWKNKKVVIDTHSSRKSVLTSVTVNSEDIGHQHKVLGEAGSFTGGPNRNNPHSHSVSTSTTTVVSFTSSESDQIVYLG